MNLPQALAIVEDHIRIGKGMKLVNSVPEALEMVVEELEVTRKALELACASRANSMFGGYHITADDLMEQYLAQAKAGEK